MLNREAISFFTGYDDIQGHKCTDKKSIAEQLINFFTFMEMQNFYISVMQVAKPGVTEYKCFFGKLSLVI